jgi:hypothetical protein
VIPSRVVRRASVVAAVLLSMAAPAHAYEFWLRARTTGQAYQMRQYRLFGPDLFLGRHRVTESLALRIFDIGDLAAARRLARMPEHGLRVSWQSYLRIDHDFGDYSSGRIALSQTQRRDALDVIPELSESIASLDLMYGFLEIEGLADDQLRLQVGRVLVDDGWGTGAIDGASAHYELPAPVAVSVQAGLRVRDRSPLGVAAYELDGTSGAGCQEYVEGPTPGTGSWKLIDRNRMITNHRLASDYELCPQRDVMQPTVGVAISTARMRRFGAELGYRRTWSETVGLIHGADRLQVPDVGFYPNESGQAPGSGTNEERLYARVHGRARAGGIEFESYGDARFSLLHAAFDRADVGLRMRRGAHTLEPLVAYFLPTFDGDSIFNAFSIEPTLDARLAYEYTGFGPWQVRADGWVRKYLDVDGSSVAGGVDASLERVFGRGWRGRLDGLADAGYGGQRVGGTAEAAWRRGRMWLRGRAIVLGVANDDTASTIVHKYVTSSAVISSTWRLADRVAVHAIAEADDDRIHDFQIRAIGVLDLAFAQEP